MGSHGISGTENAHSGAVTRSEIGSGPVCRIGISRLPNRQTPHKEPSATLYFVTAGRADEMEVIRKLQPPCLLLSYWYFRKKDLHQWYNSLGYTPKILLDSGAWSAYNAGAEIFLGEYMEFIRTHKGIISEYINLDVIGKPAHTAMNQGIMEAAGYFPIPVFHYGEPLVYLEAPMRRHKRIALGGTVPIRDKRKVAEWIGEICYKYPDCSFHILGTSSKVVAAAAPSNATMDSSAWIMMAANGWPKSIPGRTIEDKRARMTYWMKEALQ